MKVRRMVFPIACIVAWVAILPLATNALFIHQLAWFEVHPDGVQTEDEWLEYGDIQEIFDAWVTAGWIPVVIGAIGANSLNERTRATNNRIHRTPERRR